MQATGMRFRFTADEVAGQLIAQLEAPMSNLRRRPTAGLLFEQDVALEPVASDAQGLGGAGPRKPPIGLRDQIASVGREFIPGLIACSCCHFDLPNRRSGASFANRSRS